MFARMLDAFRTIGYELAGRFERLTAAAVDSQSVKTTESSGPAGYDADKKAAGRKRTLPLKSKRSRLRSRFNRPQRRTGTGLQPRSSECWRRRRVSRRSGRTAVVRGRSWLPNWRSSVSDPLLRSSENPRVSKSSPFCAAARRGANLRLDIALSTFGEGLRAKLGELAGVVATGRVPLHDAPIHR